METDISFANTGILTKQEYDEANLVKTARDDGLDRNAFLTLLTTQLQNQNPLDPMKNEQFVAQLAQFSQLEGITNMSTSLSDVADVIRSDRIMTGANLVGKSVLDKRVGSPRMANLLRPSSSIFPTELIRSRWVSMTLFLALSCVRWWLVPRALAR